MEYMQHLPEGYQLTLDNQKDFIPWIDGVTATGMDVIIREYTRVDRQFYYSIPWFMPLDDEQRCELFNCLFFLPKNINRNQIKELREATMLEF